MEAAKRKQSCRCCCLLLTPLSQPTLTEAVVCISCVSNTASVAVAAAVEVAAAATKQSNLFLFGCHVFSALPFVVFRFQFSSLRTLRFFSPASLEFALCAFFVDFSFHLEFLQPQQSKAEKRKEK